MLFITILKYLLTHEDAKDFMHGLDLDKVDMPNLCKPDYMETTYQGLTTKTLD